ncbi:MAG: hypothetical protein K2O03_15910 [Lachnospiraceae bacterium]|nr:hypothetical protein [Lachnospiraceae bacterium]
MKKWTKKLIIAFCSIWTSFILIGILGSVLPELPSGADSGCAALCDDGKGKQSPLEEMDELI